VALQVLAIVKLLMAFAAGLPAAYFVFPERTEF